MTTSGATDEPAVFRAAVDTMRAAVVHPGIEVGPIRPPQRLAPFSYALGAEVRHPDGGGIGDGAVPEHSDSDAFGRLILLHDPDGHDTWQGTLRLVAYIQADVESALAADPLLPEVAWSWLVDTLADRTDDVVALGGTVTATSSVRFGDIAGPSRAHQLEVRASWTPTSSPPALAAHVEAFCDVLAYAAGLPPAGITRLENH